MRIPGLTPLAADVKRIADALEKLADQAEKLAKQSTGAQGCRKCKKCLINKRFWTIPH